MSPTVMSQKTVANCFAQRKELAASVEQVLAAGVQPVILAMGDKAIDTTLKVIEQTPKPSTLPNRASSCPKQRPG